MTPPSKRPGPGLVRTMGPGPSGGAGARTVKDLVQAKIDELSPAERTCARTLLADYPGAGLASASELARRARTSTPTVLRFAARLGFASYKVFQQRLRDEVSTESSPVQRSARAWSAGPNDNPFSVTVGSRSALCAQVVGHVPEAEFTAAVSLLAGRPKGVLVAGGYFTHHLAHLFADQLMQIIPGVTFAGEPLRHDVSRYLDLRKGSVVVLLDFRRHEVAATRVAKLARSRGAKVIVVTDQDLSPSVQYADVALPIPVDGIPFDSHAGVLVLLEALVQCVFDELGQCAIERMHAWEDSVDVPRDNTQLPSSRGE